MNQWTRAVALTVTTFACAALARDTTHYLPFEPVVARGVATGKLDANIKFHLEGTGPAGGTVLKDYVVANKKTSGVGKSDEEACDWALLSALMELQEEARRVGANTVTNIVSYYKKMEYKDGTRYECHAGGIMTSVAVKAKLVKH